MIHEMKRIRTAPNMDILLIGLPDQGLVRKLLLALKLGSRVRCCRNTKDALPLLLSGKAGFFILEAGLGHNVCLKFFSRLLQNRPTYGALIGDSIEALLGVNALNSGLILDAMVRPVRAAALTRALERYEVR